MLLPLLSEVAMAQIDEKRFMEPDSKYRPVPLWFWNNTAVERNELINQFRQMIQRDGYGGCGILPFGGDFKPEYLSDAYFDRYGAVVEEAKSLGATMSLYDEYGFPSGSMGAINGDGVPRFMNKYPDRTVKRLDKMEYPAEAPLFEAELPEGKLMAAVAMDTLTGERRSLRPYVQGERLRWQVPGGAWKVMLFVCVKDGDPNVDYLSPEAVRLFVKETHQAYYDRFGEYFGNVITETFFDEPTMYRAQGRMWTEAFNDKYEAAYGESPELLYPALWYDIGQETQFARNRLFGFRSRLYAEGFMKTVQEWATAHGIHATGHQDQEEIENPVSVSGDLMLWCKYIDLPGIDKIGGGRPTERFYKVISSAAYNWDKREVMSETYGAMGNLSVGELYRIAMEQYTKGVNKLIPHAVWYNDRQVTFLPELSWRNPLYRDSLPALNKFLSRLNYVLQREGRHVADIAVLYPIETLQGEHYLDGKLGFYEGGVRVPDTDYTRVSALLTDTLGSDFTYLHPEVLAEKCKVKGNGLVMKNKINEETFHTVILPAVKTVSLANLKKIAAFQRKGGQVIFTTRLPEKSVEKGKDTEVKALVKRMLARGASYVERLSPSALCAVLTARSYTPDVAFAPGKELNYIHKVAGNQHVYYLANLKPLSYQAEVSLRGKITPRLLNPHTGETVKAEYSYAEGVTRVRVDLPSNASVFIVGDR